MFHPNLLNRTPSNTKHFLDACARTRAAALERGIPPESLRPFVHASDKDVFFEGESAAGEALFFKAHVGTPAELRLWTEPASARWAERAGCGAKVFPTRVDGVLVTSRLPGRPMTRAEGSDPTFVRQVANSLHRLHNAEASQATEGVSSTTGAARDRISDALRDKKVGERLYRQILLKADWIDAQFAAYKITPQRRFGDCHFGNWILVEGKINAVDLADSCYGDPFADLARYAYCLRFDHDQLQAMLGWYCEVREVAPTDPERRRLRLHAMAQNLDYFGYFASLQGPTVPATQGLAKRLLEDEAIEPDCPRADFTEIFGG